MVQQRTVMVGFHTDRSGAGPFMWGQTALWNVINQLPEKDTSLNGLGLWAVPEGRSLGEVLEALRALVERHDSLRTRFRDTPGGLVQEVAGSGELAVAVHEVGSGPVDDAAAVIGEALRDIPFDNAVDLPLRVAVAAHRETPLVVLIAVSHMAIDGWSGSIVRDDLADLLALRELPAAGRQPLERAAYEATPLARSRETRALEYWARNFRQVPNSMMTAAGSTERPDFTWSMLESPAMALAARSLSLRSGVEPGVVVLAAAAALVAVYTGEEEAALRMIVSTRFQAATRRLVGAFNQNALFRIGIVDEQVDQFLARAQEAALRAFCHCECDPRTLDSIVADIASERGIAASAHCYFNDVRTVRAERTGAVDPEAAAAAAAGIAEALSETRITRPAARVSPTKANYFLYLRELDTRAVLTLCVENGFFPSAGPGDFLADLERLLTRAATQDLSVRELCAGFRWRKTGPAAARAS